MVAFSWNSKSTVGVDRFFSSKCSPKSLFKYFEYQGYELTKCNDVTDVFFADSINIVAYRNETTFLVHYKYNSGLMVYTACSMCL